MSNPAIYEQVVQHARETALLVSTEAVLGWDEQTLMPPAAKLSAPNRSRSWPGWCTSGGPIRGWANGWRSCKPVSRRHGYSQSGATIRELKRQYDKRVNLPQALVKELAAHPRSSPNKLGSTARKNNDFPAFKPLLERCSRLSASRPKCRATAAVATTRCWMTSSRANRHRAWQPCGRRCASGWCRWWRQLPRAAVRPNIEILSRHYPLVAQQQFGKFGAEKIGFDFHRGRFDVTPHPFTTGLGPHDCRITTRYDEHFFRLRVFRDPARSGTWHLRARPRLIYPGCRRARRYRWEP